MAAEFTWKRRHCTLLPSDTASFEVEYAISPSGSAAQAVMHSSVLA